MSDSFFALKNNTEYSKTVEISVAFILCQDFIFKCFSDFIDVLDQLTEKHSTDSKRFIWSIVGEKNKAIRSSCHIDLLPRKSFDEPEQYDCIVIVGGRSPVSNTVSDDAVRFIRNAHENNIPLVGIASGRHVLARQNLLNGHKCAVDPFCELSFRSAYPGIETISYQPFVVDSQLVTCPSSGNVVTLASTLMTEYIGSGLEKNHCTLEAQKMSRSEAFGDKDVIDTNQVLEYMKRNLSVPMSIKTLAEQLGTTPSQLDNNFVSEVGMTPASIWRKLRLDRAHWLLLNTQQKITDIALECGYYDSAHFNKVFKSSFSVTPKIVRKEKMVFKN